MTRLARSLGPLIEHTLPWFVLAILLVYNYAKFFEHPYQGFKLDTNGQVIQVYVPPGAGPALQPGDRVTRLNGIPWDDFKNDMRLRLFDGVRPGQTVTLQIERAGRPATLAWRFPGPSAPEVLDLVINEGWLAFAFWIIGSVVLLILRPKDQRWRLLVAFNYLTAVWLAAGSGVSFYHIWDSAIVLRMVVWVCVPVYLWLSWVFPRPLGARPLAVAVGSYLVAIGLSAAEWFQLLPPGLYFAGFILAVFGSAFLFALHAIFQADVRRDLGLVLAAGILSLLPSVLLGLVSLIRPVPVSAGAALVSLPFLPLSYFYAAYRHQLGDFEMRVNRIVLAYVFISLLLMVFLPLIILVTVLVPAPDTAILVGLAAAFLAAIASIFGFGPYQSFMERRLMGIQSSFERLQERYAAHIVSSTSINELAAVLRHEVLPSILVRQFVFLDLLGALPKTVLAVQVDPERFPAPSEMPALLAGSGKYHPADPLAAGQGAGWIQLAVPLRVGARLVGLWLFGRRDPDDAYARVEILALQALADQTAIALSYILQTEHIKAMYQANIDRQEEERLRLALELHDGVLNQIAAILIKLDNPALPSATQLPYDILIQRLRDIIGNLRPPMLSYGLKPALEDLADRLADQAADPLKVSVELDAGDERYPPNFEQHLYRIIQEACQNSLKHGRATAISITGRLDPQEILLVVRDDGVGFDTARLDLDRMITNEHFGLTGIIQRAELIGGEVRIVSLPGEGTQISVSWKAGSPTAVE
jgi:signal transduction histidine kinase